MLPTFYISDCFDDNVRGRYAARIATTVPQAGPVQFIGAQSDLEAAGNLCDVLDGLEGTEAIIFVNVAPRGTVKTTWPNGTPFGYVKFNNAHIFTTIDGYALSLLKKVSQEPIIVAVYDIPTVVSALTPDTSLQQHIINSQFRSFDFLPRIAGHVLSGNTVPTTEFTDIPDAPTAVWWTDNFGNAKLTITAEETSCTVGQTIQVKIGNTEHALPYYNRLKDLPHGKIGMYTGSSGFGKFRFLEITKQKGESLSSDHSKPLGIVSGELITFM